ncbi:MAG: ABC transporter ATP-binding protein [Caldimonas sp.]
MKKVRVECDGIGLSFGQTQVLRDVSIDIEPGEFFALLGPSGSGKSTLLRLIAGFNQQQHGSVRIDGVDVSGKPPWQRNVGMVFQSYALWPHLTVQDNVAFGLVERKVNRAERDRRVQAALELVGLGAYGARRPNQLSGGQQQRVALARTIVIEPQVLLLDEPLSNLDRTLRVQMRQELLSLQRRLGLTTIFVTHDQEEAMSTADRMAVLEHGVVQQIGTPAELYDRPANAFVAGFVGTMNFLPAKVLAPRGDRVDVEIEGVGRVDDVEVARPGAPGGAGSAAQTGKATASFRPQALRMAAPGEEAGGGCVWIEGVVEAVEFLGESTRYRVRAGTNTHTHTHALTVDQPHHAGASSFDVDARVRLGLEPGRVRVFCD